MTVPNGTGQSATSRLYLNPSGNLGLGVTPSAWDTLLKAIVVEDTAVFSGQTNSEGMRLGSNWYYDGGFKYQTSATATRYDQASGAHSWFTAASGTAGNAITFTQAMTLDASGNLLVGATSAAGTERLNVVGGTGIRVNEDGSGTKVISIRSDFAGLGPTINVTTNDPLLFQTNNTERARITSGGVVSVNASNPTLWSGERLHVQASIDGAVASFRSLQGGTNVGQIIFLGRGGNLSGYIEFADTTTQYITSSDRRLKENIIPANDAGELIDQIEIVSHDWKNGGHVKYGVIAQDLHKVAPEAVGVGDADDVEELKNPWGVDYSKLVPMLVKEVQSLRKRVAELEAK
jgi:hypothetical protein